jgi:hypothetical protein
MKKLLAIALIAFSLLASPAFASVDPYEDWFWLNGMWVYTGDDPNPTPPPPLPPVKL